MFPRHDDSLSLSHIHSLGLHINFFDLTRDTTYSRKWTRDFDSPCSKVSKIFFTFLVFEDVAARVVGIFPFAAAHLAVEIEDFACTQTRARHVVTQQAFAHTRTTNTRCLTLTSCQGHETKLEKKKGKNKKEKRYLIVLRLRPVIRKT